MKVLESGENYLETILILKEKTGSVRSIDIVRELDFTKPSVSVAMKRLKEDGFIHVDSGGYITLTPTGEAIAREIYERHTILTAALCKLGVDEDIAKEDACKMEHYISKETFEKIKEHLAKGTEIK
ncbi:MAG: metal-dependent transcriptional regulator [Anaerovoracaceae bacterium]